MEVINTLIEFFINFGYGCIGLSVSLSIVVVLFNAIIDPLFKYFEEKEKKNEK